jgi:hypothetical protein
MNKIEKILCLYAMIFLVIAIPAFSDIPDIPGLGDLQKTVGEFSKSLANSLPFNSTMGLNWSDAYIGQIFALPPHFGIGITAGFTTMDFGSLNGLLGMFKVPLPDSVNIGGFSLPGYTIDARIGGFILPFDVGFKLGILKLNPDFLNSLINTGIPDFSMDYLLVGGDLRYALVKGKSKTFPLNVSIGAGFNYLKGGIAMPVPGIDTLKFNITDDRILNIPVPELGLNWQTKSLDLKVQASFKVLILTPYIGFGASQAWSSAGYEIKSKIGVTDENGIPVDLDDDVKHLIEGFGISSIGENGFSQIGEIKGWSFRAFGGFSINVPFVKFDLTGMYDFISKCYGFTFGTRFQL